MKYQHEDYKNLFKSNLQPFLDMLESEQQKMDFDHWMEKVSRLSASAAGNPEQYVGRVMPFRSVTVSIIEEIFEDFIREHSQLEENILHA